MYWASISRETLIGPFMVEEGMKMDSETYAHFLKQFFLTSTTFNAIPSKGNASICTTMPHLMLPSIREIFWLRKYLRKQSL